MKILVLSDIHYGIKTSSFVFNIIKEEFPDYVVLLGDVVDNYKTNKPLLEVYKEFIDLYSKVFLLSKTVLLFGDNDTQSDTKVINYVENLPTMNSNKRYFEWNGMSFFHGNLESSKITEKVGKYGLLALNKVSLDAGPKLLANRIRKKFSVPKANDLFVGHIHLLKQVSDKDFFCGTFNTEKIVYDKSQSLGYVMIRDREVEMMHLKS